MGENSLELQKASLPIKLKKVNSAHVKWLIYTQFLSQFLFCRKTCTQNSHLRTWVLGIYLMTVSTNICTIFHINRLMCYVVLPWNLQEIDSRTPHGYQNPRCLSPLYTMASYLHITYMCGWVPSVSHSVKTSWTVAHQAPLFMEFSRKEYWSGLLCPPPGESSQSRNWTHIFCSFPTAGRFFTADPLGKPHMYVCVIRKRRKQRSHIHKKK